MSFEQGRQAEEFVRRRLDLEECDRDWCDAVDPVTGEKYEIKSAQPERRFRLWANNHRSLSASGAQNGEAWYIFLTDNRPMIKAKSTEVTEWVNERGGWNKAGHSRRDGKQLKIPVDWVYQQVD